MLNAAIQWVANAGLFEPCMYDCDIQPSGSDRSDLVRCSHRINRNRIGSQTQPRSANNYQIHFSSLAQKTSVNPPYPYMTAISLSLKTGTQNITSLPF